MFIEKLQNLCAETEKAHPSMIERWAITVNQAVCILLQFADRFLDHRS